MINGYEERIFLFVSASDCRWIIASRSQGDLCTTIAGSAKNLSCQYFDFSCLPLWSGRIINGPVGSLPSMAKYCELWMRTASFGGRQKGSALLLYLWRNKLKCQPGGWNIIFGLKLWALRIVSAGNFILHMGRVEQCHYVYCGSAQLLPKVLGRSMGFNYTFEEAAIKVLAQWAKALSCRLKCPDIRKKYGWNPGYNPLWTR